MTNKRAIAFLQKMEEVKKAKLNKQKQLQVKPIVPISKPSIPIQQLQSRYDYTCERCNEFICYDTLWCDDIKGKYIALNPKTMLPHHCKKKSNGVLVIE